MDLPLKPLEDTSLKEKAAFEPIDAEPAAWTIGVEKKETTKTKNKALDIITPSKTHSF